MTIKLNINQDDFEEKFNAFLCLERKPEADLTLKVHNILADIQLRGDAALIEYTTKWDHLTVHQAGEFRLNQDAIKKIAQKATKDQKEALELAHRRITDFHQAQYPTNYEQVDDTGVKLGWRWGAVDAVGLYIPGGAAAYPSSVLMNAIPAQVAKVSRIVAVTPAGQINPLVAAALELCQIDEVYTIGGAQAIAALAYGTKTISPVDMITGPGNAFVAEAKRQVFGIVGIDMVAGPSEILVIADSSAQPEWLAADLLSQAEHDHVAQAILITDDMNIAIETEKWVEKHLQNLKNTDIARSSWQHYGAIIVVNNLEQACILSDRIAPEHLELMVDDPEKLFKKCRHAGSVFLGHYTPEALGDYLAGPNHVLPTARSARFSSGLGVLNFMKRSTYIKGTQQSANHLHEFVGVLADGEGLEAHGRSARLRIEKE